MAFEHLRNLIRGEVQRILRLQAAPRHARVLSYDPVRYAVKVGFLPEFDDPDPNVATKAMSGWVPVETHWSGSGWGMYSPPSPGDQVKVIFQENDPDSGTVTGRVYDLLHPPLPVPAGEFWLVHASGSFIKITNDTKVSFNAVGDLDVTVGGNANITVTGQANLTAPTTVIDSAVTINGSITVT